MFSNSYRYLGGVYEIAKLNLVGKKLGDDEMDGCENCNPGLWEHVHKEAAAGNSDITKTSPQPFDPGMSIDDPRLFELLKGTHCESSPLRLLRGLESTVLRDIYCEVIQADRHRIDYGERSVVLAGSGTAAFPPPSSPHINVNMMPFDMDDLSSLPSSLEGYKSLIKQCMSSQFEDRVARARRGSKKRVGYLTVHESVVKRGETQRRPGLHTETPGKCPLAEIVQKGGVSEPKCIWYHHWGMGHAKADCFDGGIYVASNVAASTIFYDVEVKSSEVLNVVKADGGIDHLKSLFGRGILNEANDIYWMNDRVPHAGVVAEMEEGQVRQFFRLVAGGVSLWFDEHSTKNEKVTLPENVQVIRGKKAQHVKSQPRDGSATSKIREGVAGLFAGKDKGDDNR
jgi:hypothetical protein